jgi:hypothetical protein
VVQEHLVASELAGGYAPAAAKDLQFLLALYDDADFKACQLWLGSGYGSLLPPELGM